MGKILLAGLSGMLATSLAVLPAACVRDPTSSPPTPSSLSGSYSLATVDGRALPFPVVDVGAYHLQIVSGTLAMTAGGTYSFTIGLRVDDSGNIRFDADSDTGYWSVADRTLGFTSTRGKLPRTATVDGAVLTMQSGTRVFVMRRQ